MNAFAVELQAAAEQFRNAVTAFFVFFCELATLSLGGISIISLDNSEPAIISADLLSAENATALVDKVSSILDASSPHGIIYGPEEMPKHWKYLEIMQKMHMAKNATLNQAATESSFDLSFKYFIAPFFALVFILCVMKFWASGPRLLREFIKARLTIDPKSFETARLAIAMRRLPLFTETANQWKLPVAGNASNSGKKENERESRAISFSIDANEVKAASQPADTTKSQIPALIKKERKVASFASDIEKQAIPQLGGTVKLPQSCPEPKSLNAAVNTCTQRTSDFNELATPQLDDIFKPLERSFSLESLTGTTNTIIVPRQRTSDLDAPIIVPKRERKQARFASDLEPSSDKQAEAPQTTGTIKKPLKSCLKSTQTGADIKKERKNVRWADRSRLRRYFEDLRDNMKAKRAQRASEAAAESPSTENTEEKEPGLRGKAHRAKARCSRGKKALKAYFGHSTEEENEVKEVAA